MLDHYLLQFLGDTKKQVVRTVLLMMGRVLSFGLLAVLFAKWVSGSLNETNSFIVGLSFILLILLRAFTNGKILTIQAKIAGAVKANIRQQLLENQLH